MNLPCHFYHPAPSRALATAATESCPGNQRDPWRARLRMDGMGAWMVTAVPLHTGVRIVATWEARLLLDRVGV